MPQPDTVISLVESLAAPLCAAQGVEFVDARMLTEGGERVLRVVIDRERTDGRPGSDIFVEDCQRVSRALGELLEAREDELPPAFRLEVSSPGVERPLVRLADYERFAGRDAVLRTVRPVDERKKFEGKLLGVADRNVRIECSGRVHLVPHEAVGKANLVVRFDRIGNESR